VGQSAFDGMDAHCLMLSAIIGGKPRREGACTQTFQVNDVNISTTLTSYKSQSDGFEKEAANRPLLAHESRLGCPLKHSPERRAANNRRAFHDDEAGPPQYGGQPVTNIRGLHRDDLLIGLRRLQPSPSRT
jgi:hypothetical protein